jgi:MFS superfamily sulfate permease-like transporter
MMKVAKMRQLWDLRRVDFWLAMIALVAVLLMPTLEALAIAVIASLAVLVWRVSEPRMTFLGRAKGGLESVDLRTSPEAEVPGLLIVRPDEMLFFANAASVRDASWRPQRQSRIPRSCSWTWGSRPRWTSRGRSRSTISMVPGRGWHRAG